MFQVVKSQRAGDDGSGGPKVNSFRSKYLLYSWMFCLFVPFRCSVRECKIHRNSLNGLSYFLLSIVFLQFLLQYRDATNSLECCRTNLLILIQRYSKDRLSFHMSRPYQTQVVNRWPRNDQYEQVSNRTKFLLHYNVPCQFSLFFLSFVRRKANFWLLFLILKLWLKKLRVH